MSESTFKTQHEQFDPEAKSNRIKVIRQDRRSIEHLDAKILFSGQEFNLVNISAYGLAFKSTHPFELGSFVSQASVLIESYEIAKSEFKIVRCESQDGFFQIGAEILGEPIGMGRVDAIEKTQNIIRSEHQRFEENQNVPAEFARRVYEVKDLLENIQQKVNSFEKNLVHTDHQAASDFEDTVIKMISEYLNQVLPTRNEELSLFVKGLTSEQLKSCYEFFRSKLYHLIYQSPFADRTFHKPLGYAGDYEMMNIIYSGEKLGHSLFARCLSYYWVGQPAAQAVRNRANYLIRRISEVCEKHKDTDRTIRILSVACGPVMEWQRFVSEIKKYNYLNIEVDLIDQDENALKHSQHRLRDLSSIHKNNFKFNFINKAIKNIIGKGLDKKNYDLIYTAGLFDYFTDPVAQFGGQRLFESLAPEGELVIGNFNVENPNTCMMDMALDWNLIYRSDADMIRLFGGFSPKVVVEKEDLNINLFCRVWK